MNKKLTLCCLLIMFFLLKDANASLNGVNKATQVLCEIITLIRGRIGRAITMFAILGLAIAFVLGSISWQKLMMVSVGIGIFYGAESIALVILPSTVAGISGTMADGTAFDPSKKYSPQEILSNVCPSLGMYGAEADTRYSS